MTDTPKSFPEQLDDILQQYFDIPYPDYNMGLLPDEEGYDNVKAQRNYEEENALYEAKLAILTAAQQLTDEIIGENFFLENVEFVGTRRLILTRNLLKNAQRQRRDQLLKGGSDERTAN